MTLVKFFIFIGRYGSFLRDKLREELKRKPTLEEISARYAYAFKHMENIRAKKKLISKCHLSIYYML